MTDKVHVRNDWQLLYTPLNKNRVMTLCGKKSTPSRCGTPGITAVTRGNWCAKCIWKVTLTLAEFYSYDQTGLTNGVLYTYHMIAAEVLRIRESPTLSRSIGKDVSYVLPAWDKYSRSLNNRLFVIWSTLIDQCEDETHPNYPAWGARGITVHPDWQDFRSFVDDAPKGATGVFPKPGATVIGPSTAVWK